MQWHDLISKLRSEQGRVAQEAKVGAQHVGKSISLAPCTTRESFSESNKCSRARHVKCDELKPSCFICTSTGRKCDGYESAGASGLQQALLLHERIRSCTSKTSPLNDSPVSLALTLGLPSNEQSNRFFHSFLHGCVPSLTEVMDSEFWQRGILRASSSPVIQHAAIAFGAVYEQRIAHQNHAVGPTTSSIGQQIEILSSIRYENAIRILRRQIAELSQAPEGLEEIMIACLIFVFMEILRGDDIAAVTHLDGVLKLYSCAEPSIQDIISARDNNIAPTVSTAFEGFVKILLRLETQSVQYMGSRTPWYPDSNCAWLHTTEDMPAMFETFLDARDNFYAHLAKIMNFITPPEGAEKCFPEWCPHPDRGFDIYTIFHGSTYRDCVLPRASTQRRHLMHVLSRWKSAFQGFLQKGTAKTPEALASCALLWLEYYTMRIKLAVSYTEDECCYDAQLPSFKKIAEQAEAYLRYTAHNPRSQLPRHLSGNLGTIPSLKPKKKDFKVYSSVCYPLYYTVLKCRYKPLRESALAMLRNANTEGVWDANMLARVGEFVTAVEEHSITAASQDSCADAPNFGVPEMSRIHCLSLNIVKSQQTVWLRYSRRAIETRGKVSNDSNPPKRWRIGSTVLTWQDVTAQVAEIIDTEQYPAGSLPTTVPPWENQTLAYRSPQPQC